MGRYFGRQPRYSQEEAEAQAKAAFDAAVNKGRPPEEEWKALGSRMGEINRELATRPPVDLPSPPPRRAATGTRNPATTGQPRAINQILRPPPPPAPEPAPPRRPKRAPAPPPAAPRKAAAAAPAKRATAAPAKQAKLPPEARPAPAKRGAQASDPAPAQPVKRSVRATGKRAPSAAKRPAAKRRPE